MRVILLDTSLVLDCVKLKIDVFAELERLMEGPFEARTSEGIMRELRKKAEGKGKAGADARFALSLLENRGISVEQGGLRVDDWLLSRGRELDAVVCTNDAELRARLRESGVRVVSVRGRSRLDYV